jgi:arginyl-tRNA synthetase
MIREEIKKIIKKAIKNLQKEGRLPDFEIPEIKVEHPENEIYGDYATNIAMRITKKVKQDPMGISKLISKKLVFPDLFEKVEEKKPGFINFFISKEYLQKKVKEILDKKEKFGQLKIGKNKKVQVEFVSANPTGPLTLGNGRGGFCGDVLANILTKAGYKTEREYYINDIGEQIRKLGHSVIGDSEAVYKGKYIEELRKRVKGDNPDKVGEKSAKIILKEMIKPLVKDMGIKFDVWFSEKSLYKNKDVDKVLKYLKNKNLTYEKEGALWFKSAKFGDDKDRVLVRKNGEKTYFASDIAYLKNKFTRRFKKIIYFWGADHYGYIKRMQAAIEALGYKKEQADFIIMQLVAVMWQGQRQRMSKRKGIYWGLDKLINELGLDIVRFFFLTRSPGSHLIFDLDLAKEQSEKNPVYYVQYAFARICSILRRGKIKDLKLRPAYLKLLENESELRLIKELNRFPEIIEDIIKDYQVQIIPQYSIDLATIFHQFYRDCRVLVEDENLKKARLALIMATKIVLENTFSLMGISAPEKM